MGRGGLRGNDDKGDNRMSPFDAHNLVGGFIKVCKVCGVCFYENDGEWRYYFKKGLHGMSKKWKGESCEEFIVREIIE